ncbi:nitroreductase family protein [Pseudonocardia hydrocarbonoxydans]
MNVIPGALGLTGEQVDSLLTTAGRAPSLHNSQPWRFGLAAQAIELHADPERRLPATDPDDRELRIACGAALFNLRLALHGLGIRPVVTILPNRRRPTLLAVVRASGRKPATPEQQRLLRAVPLRRTNRQPFTDTRVTVQEQYALRRAAQDEGAWLHLVADPPQRRSLQQIAKRAHEVQMADPQFRAELQRWLTDSGTSGVPATAAGPPPEPQDKWVLRDYTAGTGQPRVPGKDFEPEPLIAVLTPYLGGPDGEIQAGQAMQRVLLTATAEGLATSFLSHLVEVPRAREELRRLIGATQPPQVVLRIGHGWPVPATPRRGTADLVEPEPSRR